MTDLGPLWSAHCWRPGPEEPSRDNEATRKVQLQYRINDLFAKQRPRIKAPDASPPYRPSRESIVQAMTDDPAPSARTPYPRTTRAPNRADPYFSPRAGTQLHQLTPSYGVGETGRYGRGDVYNVGSLGDTGTPGSQLHTSGRYRGGERPAHSPGARRIPPNKQYGLKDGTSVDRSGPRTTPLDGHQYIEQQSQTSENAYRKPLLVGVRTQPRSKRPSRRQGYMPLDPSHKQAANVQGQLHVSQRLGERRCKRRKQRIAGLLAKRVELAAVRDTLKHQQIVKQALAQADAALQPVNNSRTFVKGYHDDHSHFAILERAIELYKQEKAQEPTMKGLR